MLTEKYASLLDEWILPQTEFKPFPEVQDRAEWDALPEELRQSLVQAGVPHLNEKWPRVPLSLYIYSAIHRLHDEYYIMLEKRKVLTRLVTAECAENSGRFMNDIVNGIWDMLDEFTWVTSYHVGIDYQLGKYKSAPDPIVDPGEQLIDHVASECCGLLSVIYYMLGSKLDAISPHIRKRMKLELQRRITIPYLENDFYWLKRTNNWNAWCNSNCLMVYLLVEDDAERRTAGIRKIMGSLDVFLAAYPPDGGCDEGPNYWPAGPGCLLDALELLHQASNGKIDIFQEHKIHEMGKFPYRIYIGRHQPGSHYYVNFADAYAYHSLPENVIYRFGRRTNEESVRRFGAFVMQENMLQKIHESTGWLYRKLHTIFDYDEIMSTEPLEFPESEVWLSDLQVMTARDMGERFGTGFFLAAKGGHNAENHNHNDVGQFVVYHNGNPVIVDMGAEEYKDKTFSSERYEVPNMNSGYHNLPTVNNFNQKDGRLYAAKNARFHSDGPKRSVELSLDIADAYPQEAGIRNWVRTYRLDREKHRILITEQYELERETKDVTITMMTPLSCVLSPVGVVTLAGTTGQSWNIIYDPEKLNVAVEEFTKADDSVFTRNWGERLYRLLFRFVQPSIAGRLTFEIQAGNGGKAL